MWRIETPPQPAVVKFDGEIDEHFVPDALKEIESPIILDLRSVERVTSAGIVRWLSFVKKCGSRLTLRACSPQVVGSMNMLRDFLGECRVESVVVPMYCPVCHVESFPVYSSGKLRAAYQDTSLLRHLLAQQCTKCKVTLAVDASLDDYFSFFAYARLPREQVEG